MPKALCPCGASYTVPATSLGKKARCKKCGTVFRLEEPPQEEEDQGIFALADDVDQRLQRAADVDAAELAAAEAARTLPGEMDLSRPSSALSTPATVDRSYWGDLLWTFLFPANAHNLAVWLGFWVVLGTLGALPVLGCFALVQFVVVQGLYSVFRLQTIEAAAGGDEELPTLSGSDAWLLDMAAGLFKWYGSLAIVLLPAFIYGLTAFGLDDLATFVDGSGFSGAGGAAVTTKLVVLVVLWAAGMFLWPMVVLCVSLGGFSSVVRIDLMMATIIRAFPAYLATVILVYAAGAANVVAQVFIQGQLNLNWFVGGIVAFGVQMYPDIVACRVIGLFYHHFKRRFAWSWG